MSDMRHSRRHIAQSVQRLIYGQDDRGIRSSVLGRGRFLSSQRHYLRGSCRHRPWDPRYRPWGHMSTYLGPTSTSSLGHAGIIPGARVDIIPGLHADIFPGSHVDIPGTHVDIIPGTHVDVIPGTQVDINPGAHVDIIPGAHHVTC